MVRVARLELYKNTDKFGYLPYFHVDFHNISNILLVIGMWSILHYLPSFGFKANG